MAPTSRSQQIQRMFKVLAKNYQPVAPVDRSVVEHLLYACCLENAPHEAADDAFAKLQELYFDWNEVRVTTVKELQEVLSKLPDPADAATRVTQTLRAIFETHYDIDLEPLRKMNLGKAVEELKKYAGVSPFAVQYVVQHGLGGHAFAINQGVLDVLYVLGIISDKEHAEGKTPGLERAVPKAKGPQMASLLHQFGTAYARSPFSSKIRAIILEIEPGAKERLPKRESKKKPAAAAEEAPPQPTKGAAKKTTARNKSSGAARSTPSKTGASAKSSKSSSKPPSSSSRKAAEKSASKGASKAAKKRAKKSPAPRPAKKSATKKKSASASQSSRKRGGKSVTASLARRKPR